MASKVPSAREFTVAPQGRTPYVSSPAVDNQTGAQLQQVGNAIQQVGGVAADVFEQRAREVNQLRIDEAISDAKARANDLTFDEKDGWSFQRGRDALDRKSGLALSEEYGQRYDEELDDIEAGLANDAQRAAFARARLQISSSFRGQINKHEASEYETWATSVKKGVIETAQRDISLHYDDPERTARNIDTVRGAMYELAKLNGTDRGDHLENAIREVVSDSHSLAISAMLEDGNWTAAETYADKHKAELTEEALFKIDVAIGREEDAAIATEAADDYIAQIVGAQGAGGTEEFMQPVGGAFAATSEAGKFGHNRGTHKHGGVDLPRPHGTPIGAAASGVVTRAEYSKTYGNVVYIKHDNGMETRYAHMQGFGKGVKVGARVNRGQVIGGVGSTGRSTGPHLHYEVRDANGNPIDPTQRHKVNKGAPSKSLADVLLAMRNDPRLRGHPERLAQAEQQVRGIYGAKQQEQAQAREDARNAAYTALIQNGGDFSKLPANVRANIEGSDLPGLISFGNSVQSALRGPKPQSGSPLWAATKDDIASGRIQNVSDLLPYRPYLSDTDYKDLVTDITGGQGKIDSIKTAQQALGYVTAELAAIGIDTTPGDDAAKAETLGQFRAALYKQISVAERESGAPLKGDEARKIALALIAESSERGDGWFGTSVGDRALRGYELKNGVLPYSAIPMRAKQSIASQLRNAVPPVPVTEANILAVYRARTRN